MYVRRTNQEWNASQKNIEQIKTKRIEKKTESNQNNNKDEGVMKFVRGDSRMCN